MPIKDGPSCPGCGLPNYSGLCPHCRGDQQAYEEEFVPPFPSTRKDDLDDLDELECLRHDIIFVRWIEMREKGNDNDN